MGKVDLGPAINYLIVFIHNHYKDKLKQQINQIQSFIESTLINTIPSTSNRTE